MHDDDRNTVDIGLFRMSAPLSGGTLQALAGFLSGVDGEARASLTGRLVDGRGRVVAVGDIHPQIIQALSTSHPFVRDFALAHGCDSMGCQGDAVSGNEEARAVAWWKARKAWDTMLTLPIVRHPSP